MIPLRTARRLVLSCLLALGGLAFGQTAEARIVFFPQTSPAGAETWFRLGADGDLWLAQTCGKDCEDYGDDGKSAPPGSGVNQKTTKMLILILDHANDTCDERIEKRYRIDCLRVYYGWVADSLPNSGDYLPIKKAMRAAEKKLSAIVSANVDRDEPIIRPREQHKKNAKKLPPLRAVKKSAVKKAVAQAEAVVKETELTILRSGEDPARRTEHFKAVAEAVDSNLVVLRSA